MQTAESVSSADTETEVLEMLEVNPAEDANSCLQDAMHILQGFKLFGRSMHIAYAKARSDATVMKEDGEAGLETHKRHRKAEKGTHK